MKTMIKKYWFPAIAAVLLLYGLVSFNDEATWVGGLSLAIGFLGVTVWIASKKQSGDL